MKCVENKWLTSALQYQNFVSHSSQIWSRKRTDIHIPIICPTLMAVAGLPYLIVFNHVKNTVYILRKDLDRQ